LQPAAHALAMEDTPLQDLSSPGSLQPSTLVAPSGRVQQRQDLPLGAKLCDSLLFGSQKALSAGRDMETAAQSTWCRAGRQQRRTYGTRLLLFLTIVNLLYGVTTSWFIYINNFYLGKDLGLTPTQTQSAVATTGLCIIIRPVLGAVSDAVPILGSTRRAYFFIAAAGSACCYLVLASFEPRTQIAPGPAIGVLCVANVLGYAWCGVILYAIVATEQRRDPVDGAAQLNAIQWGFYSSGALLGDLSEGFLLKMLDSPHQCYWAMCALWSVMALCGLLYEEGRETGTEQTLRADDASLLLQTEPGGMTTPLISRDCSISELDTLSEMELHSSVAVVTADDVHTPPSQPQLDLRLIPEEVTMAEEAESPTQQRRQHGGFGVQMRKLWITLDPTGPTKGAILSAVLYIFLTWAIVPDVSSGVTYFFYTGSSAAGGLGFGPVTYSMLSVVGDVAMLVASYVYGAYLGSTPLRRLFVGLQLLNVAASALDLALALRWNELIGMNATIFAALDQAIYYLAWQLKNLPVYTLAAKVCPHGVEATLTACIAGMNDLSGSLAQYFGAGLTHLFGVSGSKFENVWLVYLVRTACKLLPIPLVILVPTEEQLAEALEALNQRLSAEVGANSVRFQRPTGTVTQTAAGPQVSSCESVIAC
jgi:hypothetical protein